MLVNVRQKTVWKPQEKGLNTRMLKRTGVILVSNRRSSHSFVKKGIRTTAHGHILIGPGMRTPMCSQCAQWTYSVSFKMWCNFLGLCWTHGKNRPNLDHNLNLSTGHIVNTLGCAFHAQLECAHGVHFGHINWLHFGCNWVGTCWSHDRASFECDRSCDCWANCGHSGCANFE